MHELSIVSFPRELLRNKILWEQWIKNTLISNTLMKSKSLSEVWIFCKEPLADQVFINLGVSVKFWRSSYMMLQAILDASQTSHLPAMIISIELSEHSLSSKTEAIDSLGQAQMARDLSFNEFQFNKWQKEILSILQQSSGFLVQDTSDNFLNLDRIQNQWTQKLTPKLIHGGRYGMPYAAVSIFRCENWFSELDSTAAISFEDWSNPSYGWNLNAALESNGSVRNELWFALKSAGVSRYVTTMITSRTQATNENIREYSAFWGCCELRDFLCFCYLAPKGSSFVFLDSMDNLRLLRKSLTEE